MPSSDPDIDAVLGSFDHPEASRDSDAASVLASFDQPKKTAPVPISATDLFGDMAKSVIGGIVHGAGTLADVATGTAPGPGSHAERWASPFAITDRLGQLDPDQQKIHQAVSNAYDKMAGTGPAATEIKTRIPQALEAIGTVVPLIKGAGALVDYARAPKSPAAGFSAEGELPESEESMGAARAAAPITQASPELQQAIRETARRSGGAVDPEALGRHLEADSLPVKVKLTAGQATQDPVQISMEQNSRLKAPELAARFQEQNKALADNITALRDRVGPDVFSTNQVEHGDTLIKAYQDKAAIADADISAKYQALRDAAGGKFPVSAPKLLANVRAALDDELLTDHAPKAEMNTLGRLADSDSMTFQNFEALRSNLARTMRSATDGNERYAAGIMRKAMEELPLAPGSAELKPLADTARAAARAQFEALDADPAYKAAVMENVPPDRFVQRFVTGPTATRDGVSLMRDNLAHDPVATQTLGVATLDHLKKAAGLNEAGEGNFSQAGFNKNLEALGPRIPSLLDPQTAEDLFKLGNVAKYTQFQPRGAAVNNSNTFVAAAAEHAKSAAEGAVNVAFKGVPVGTWVRKGLQARSQNAAVQEALKPGAGLEPKAQ